MADYSQAADSQAAYAAMPNQGLTAFQASPWNNMTQQQKAQLAGQMLMKGFQGNTPAGMGMPTALPQRAALPAQTLNAGQFVSSMGGR